MEAFDGFGGWVTGRTLPILKFYNYFFHNAPILTGNNQNLLLKFIICPFENFVLRLLSNCLFYCCTQTPFSSFWWKSGQHMSIFCLVSLFYFLCFLRCQYRRFCGSFASSAVTSGCDLSRSGYLNSLRAATCSFIILHLPHMSVPSYQGSFLSLHLKSPSHWQRLE